MKKLYLGAKQDPAKRPAIASHLARLSWAKLTPEERKARALHANSGRVYQPADPNQPRCPCGAMTLTRATARADKNGTGLGHRRGCSFYRLVRHPGTKAAAR